MSVLVCMAFRCLLTTPGYGPPNETVDNFWGVYSQSWIRASATPWTVCSEMLLQGLKSVQSFRSIILIWGILSHTRVSGLLLSCCTGLSAGASYRLLRLSRDAGRDVVVATTCKSFPVLLNASVFLPVCLTHLHSGWNRFPFLHLTCISSVVFSSVY